MKKFYMLLVALLVTLSAAAGDWYLRGDMNSWGTNLKFTQQGSKYVLDNVTIKANQKMKVDDGKWGTSYGEYNGYAKNMTAGNEYGCHTGGGDMTFGSENFQGTVEFWLTTDGWATIKFIEKTVEDHFTWALHGSFTTSSWVDVDLTGTVPNLTASNVEITNPDAQFGVKEYNNGSQTAWYAANATTTISDNYSGTLKADGKNFAIAPGKYNFTFNTETKAFTAEKLADVVVPDPVDYTVYFDATGTAANASSTIYCYMYKGDDNNGWDKCAMTKNGDKYEYTLSALWEPEYVIFHIKDGAQYPAKTGFAFENGATYNKDGKATEVTPTPDPTTTVAIAGEFNSWSLTANATSEIVENCATLTVTGFDKGFKVVVNGKYYTVKGAQYDGETYAAEIVNGKWYDNMHEGGTGNDMTLPASALGQEVTFTVAVDTEIPHLKVAWTEATPTVPVVTTVAALKAVELVENQQTASAEAKVIFKATGAKVLYSDTFSTLYLEDATGAMAVVLDEGMEEDLAAFTEGKVYDATFTGVYNVQGGTNLFMLLASEVADVTENGTADVSKGNVAVADLAEAENIYRLATVTASEELPIVLADDEAGLYKIGENIVAGNILGQIETEEYPENVKSITGLILPAAMLGFAEGDDVEGGVMIAARRLADIVAADTPTPDPTTTVAIAGDFNDWSETANATSEIVDNCATITVENWDGGEFKVFYDGKYWTTKGAEYNGETYTGELARDRWYDNMLEGGTENNMTLEAGAKGKKVSFIVAIDGETPHMMAWWEAEATPDPEVDYTQYELAIAYPDNGWGWFTEVNGGWKIKTAAKADANGIAVLEPEEFGVGQEAFTGHLKVTNDEAHNGESMCRLKVWTGKKDMYFVNGTVDKLNEWCEIAAPVDNNSEDHISFIKHANCRNVAIKMDMKNFKIMVVKEDLNRIHFDVVAPAEWETVHAHMWADGTDEACALELDAYSAPTAAAGLRADAAVTHTMHTYLGFKPTHIVFYNGTWGDTNQTVNVELAEAPSTYVISDETGENNNLIVNVTPGTTGIEGVSVETEQVEAVYFNLQGQRVNNPANGIFIVKRGNKVTKEIVK